MTRVIAGRLGGRRLSTPRGATTRPTSDRVREALFSRLESLLDLDGAAVLDLYAGSGALGLEAVSRGAAHALLVDHDRSVGSVLSRNVRDLGVAGEVTVRCEPVRRLLERGPGDTAYDLALLDPPYPLGEDDLAAVLRLLVDRAWLAPRALVVVERSTRSQPPAWPPGLTAVEHRAYGETTLHLAEPAQPGQDHAGDQLSDPPPDLR